MTKSVNITQYGKLYAKASTICLDFVKTLSNQKVNYATEPLAVFNFMCLDNLKLESRAISILINNNLYNQSMSHIRNIFEIWVNMDWLFNSSTDEQIKNVNLLLSNVFSYHDVEVRKLEENLLTDNPIWTKKKVKEMRATLEKYKVDNPELIENGKFKRPPTLEKRMSTNNRHRYYHNYRWLSIFTHPSPLLKDLHIKSLVSSENPYDIIADEHIGMFDLGIKLIFLCYVGYCAEFDNSNKNGYDNRTKILYDLKKVFLETQNQLFF